MDWICASWSDVGRNTRCPTTVGEPCPRPGIGVFQSTFFVSLHCRGGCCLGSATPLRFGPRHQGQSVAATLIFSTSEEDGASWPGPDEAQGKISTSAAIANRDRCMECSPV